MIRRILHELNVRALASNVRMVASTFVLVGRTRVRLAVSALRLIRTLAGKGLPS